MDKTRKWRKILAMMLTVVMMLQNVQSVIVSAGVTTEEIEARLNGQTQQTQEQQPSESQVETRANGETYQTQQQTQQQEEQQESQQQDQQTAGSSSGDASETGISDGSQNAGNNADAQNDTTKISNANVSATITQSIFQEEISGGTYNFAQMTAKITNNDTENAATGVQVTALLPSQLSYINEYGKETTGIIAYAAPYQAQANGYDLSAIPSETLDTYANTQIALWVNQTIGAGETAEYNFAVQIQDGITDVSGMDTVWYVNGTKCNYSWENAELLTPADAQPATFEAEENQGSPVVNGDEEVLTPTPEATETATPTPEAAETATPTPEATETATPTPEADQDEPSDDDSDDAVAPPSNEDKTMGGFNQDISSYGDLSQFFTGNGVELVIYDANGNKVDNYDPSNIDATGGRFELKLTFAETAGGTQMDNENPYYEFQLPASLKISQDISERNLEWQEGTGNGTKTTYGAPGFYKINKDNNTLYVQMNKNFVKDFPDVGGTISVSGEFKRTSSSSEDIDIGNTHFKLNFGENPIESAKGVSRYDETDGTFTFTITVTSFGAPTGTTIVDELGSNLELVPGTVKMIADGNETDIPEGAATPGYSAPGNDNKFNIRLDDAWLNKGDSDRKEIKIQYKAKIKDSALVPGEGSIPGLDNVAKVNSDQYPDGKKIKATGSYSVEWIRKPAGVLQNDGTIKWTLYVNENKQVNAKGLVVTDTLKGKGLTYDTTKPIEISVTDHSELDREIEWDSSDLTHKTNQNGEEFWSYTIPDDGKYAYTFTYYTLAQPGMDNKEYGNIGTVSKGDHSVSTGVEYGPGSGSGSSDGILSKQYNKKVTLGEDTYAQWTATIHVPQTGLKNVVFQDTLSGEHTFTSNSVGTSAPDVIITGYEGDTKIELSNSNKTMTILFGETKETSILPPAERAYDVSIQYFTKLPSSDFEGNLSNKANLTSTEKNGFTQATENIKKYSFGKEVSVDSSNPKLLNWRITLSSGLNIGKRKPLIVTDILTGDHSYIKNSAHLYGWSGSVGSIGAKPDIIEDDLIVEQDTAGKNIVFTIATSLEADYIWTIEYQTEIQENPSNSTFSNKAEFKISDKGLGEASASVDTNATRIVKNLNQEPNAGNSYRAKYSVVVDGNTLGLSANEAYTYRIKDRSDTSVHIQESTITIKDENGQDVDFGYVYKLNQDAGSGKKENVLEVTINATGPHKYTLTYDALISPDENNKVNSEGKLEYSNTAEFTTYTSKVDSEVEIKADSEGTAGAGNRYITVYKKDKALSTVMPGVEFVLQHWTGTQFENVTDPAITDSNGRLTFGNKTDDNENISKNIVALKNNQVLQPGEIYALKETTPQGYKRKGPIVFIFENKDSKKSDDYYSNFDNAIIIGNTGEQLVENESIVSVKAVKEWETETSDKTHPNSVNVTLSAKVDGEDYSLAGVANTTATLNSENSWTAQWDNLPEYSGSKKITYSVTETVPQGYRATYESATDQKTKVTTFTIKNYKVSENTSITVKKQWNDNDNSDDSRPDNVVMQLYQKVGENGSWTKVSEDTYKYNEEVNGNIVKKLYEIKPRINLNSENNWSYRWEVLPTKTDAGEEITYTVREQVTTDGGNTYTDVEKNVTKLPGKNNKEYILTNDEQSGSEYTFTNTYSYEKVSYPVKKIWNDNGDTDADAKKPSEIKLNLIVKVSDRLVADENLEKVTGKEGFSKEITLSESNDWKDTTSWSELAKYYNGVKIQYSIEEQTSLLANTGWSYTGQTWNDTDEIYEITNTYTNLISVSAIKKWDDNENQDGKRTEGTTVTFTLYRPKLNASGTYETDQSNKSNGDIIVKTTVGENQQDVVYEPYAAGHDTPQKESTGDRNAQEWDPVTWNNLEPKWGYVSNIDSSLKDTVIPYVVKETKVTSDGNQTLKGYTLDKEERNGNIFTFTNKYTPETKKIQVSKRWEDNNNQDGIRPSSISVSLTATANGKDVTDKIFKSGDKTKQITPDKNDVWGTAVWENLPRYYQTHEIVYTVNEESIEGYKSEIPKQFTQDSEDSTLWKVEIVNRHTTATTDITAKKIWNDDSNRDGKRPLQVAFQLYKKVVEGNNQEELVAKDGKEKSGYQILTSQNGTGNEWTVTWSDLPVKENGKNITYSVKEVSTTLTKDGKVQNITSKELNGYTKSENGLEVTNTYNPQTTSRSVKKVWKDGNNVDKLRRNIKVKLIAQINTGTAADPKLADVGIWQYDSTGNTFTSVVDEVELSLQDGESKGYTWENLPVWWRTTDGAKYEIQYSIQETDKPDGYTENIEYKDGTDSNNPNTFIITNTHTPIQTSVRVLKSWDDNENSDGVRPGSVELQLLADGEPSYPTYEWNAEEQKWEEKTNPISSVTIGEKNNWTYEEKNLPVYRLDKDGNQQRIKYTVEEINVDKNYVIKSNDAQPAENPEEATEIIIVNHHETTTISKQLLKYWRDTESTEERPDTVKFALYMKVYTGQQENGEKVYTDMLRVDDKTFTDLDTKKTIVPVTDEVEKEVTIPKEKDIVTASWANLPKNFNGEPIIYEIREVDVPAGYQSYSENTDDHTAVYNTTTSAEISKTDLTGTTEIPGAKLRIVDPELTEEDEGYIVEKEWTSTEEPHKVTAMLKAGKEYELQETSAPNGYLLAQPQRFTVNADGTTTKVVMKDAPTKVVISKTDTEGKELKGAKFQIVDPSVEETSKDYVVEEWESIGAPHTIEGKLTAEKTYRLIEVQAPSGFTPAEPVEFKITVLGKVLVNDKEVDAETIVVKNSKNQLAFAKIDASKSTTESPIYLENAELEIRMEVDGKPGEIATNADGEVLKWTSDNSVHTVDGLAAGTYFLVEAKAPAGYKLAAPKKFTVTDTDTKLETITMEDAPTKVSISKKDENEKPLSGAKLEIRNAAGEVVEGCQWTSDEKTHEITGKLIDGEKYYLYETEAPEGYTIADPVEFTMDTSKDVVEVTMKDIPTKVTISKKALTGTDSLGGAKLRIIDSQNKVVVEPWTTESGKDKEVTGVLKTGETYTLEEVTPPAGYAKAANITFEINAKGQIIIDDKVASAVVMRDAKIQIKVSKKDITDTDELPGTVLQILDKANNNKVIKEWTTTDKPTIIKDEKGEFVVGNTYILHEKTAPDGYAYAKDVEFILHEDSVEGNEQSVVMHDAKNVVVVSKTDLAGTKELPGAKLQILSSDGKEILEAWTSTNEEYKVTKKLKAGESYILREIEAPDGYALADDVKFTVNKDGSTTKVVMKDAPTSVTVSKTDLTGEKEIAGAKLQILNKNGKVMEEWTSDGKPHAVAAALVADVTYILHEVSAPDGYRTASDIEFTVDKTGKTTKVVMKDAPTQVSILKTDQNGKGLAGATLAVKDSTGKVLEQWTSDGSAHVIEGKLITGQTYTLSEISAPAGYRVASDQTFTMEDKDVINVTMKDTPTKVSILKTDQNGKGLAGATLAVKELSGKVLEQWISDGSAHVIEGLLTVGQTYTLSEISAPAGYTVAPDQTFTMEDKDVIEVTMVDTQETTGSGQITVTKKVSLVKGGDIIDMIANDDTFYVNIFTDAAGKYPYKGAKPQAIHLVNASAGSVTFDGLGTGTYYVYETDADGNVISLDTDSTHNGVQFMCTVDGGTNSVTLDLKAGAKEGVVNLDNMFYDIPDGYSYKANISINKQVLKGTDQTTVDDTFYAGIFTKDDDGVYNLFRVVELVQNDTVTVEVPLGGDDGTQPINYYVLETDADGNILDLDVFEYEVSGEGTVALSADNTTGNINLVNKVPEEKNGKLRVQKVDENGVGLAGASFRLTNADGEVVEEWTSEASAHELELEPGTYTLTEVQAPDGYTGEGSLTITVDEDYNFTVDGQIEYSYKDDLIKVVNKSVAPTPTPEVTPGVTPGPNGGTTTTTSSGGGSTPVSYSTLSGKVAVKTGDNTPIGVYVLVLVVAAAAIAGGVVYKKKRRKDK